MAAKLNQGNKCKPQFCIELRKRQYIKPKGGII